MGFAATLPEISEWTLPKFSGNPKINSMQNYDNRRNMPDRRNMPVEDLIRSQLQSEEEFTDQRSSHFKLCIGLNFKSLWKNLPQALTCRLEQL